MGSTEEWAWERRRKKDDGARKRTVRLVRAALAPERRVLPEPCELLELPEPLKPHTRQGRGGGAARRRTKAEAAIIADDVQAEAAATSVQDG